jgi:hypothetical protein
LPGIGDCTRFDGQYSTNKKERFVDTIANITSERLPFITAEDMLLQNKKKIDENKADN